MPLVSVVIVNWNGKRLLRSCLESLRFQRFRDFEVIVVDNGSTDGSADFVRANFPEYQVIPLDRNTGFAYANNVGITRSLASYVALLNNDARPWREWLAELVRTAEAHPDAGMFASKIILPWGDLDSAGCFLYPDGVGICRGRGQKPDLFGRTESVLFPSGCAALYRRVMLDQIGLFDARFFMYCEDTDLGVRGRAAGWDCLYVPGAVVNHLYSGSSSIWSLKKLFYVERNRLRVLWKHFSPWWLVLSFPYTLVRYYRILTRGMAWGS